MFYLAKILPVFLLPVGVTLILTVLGILVHRRALIVLAMAMLYLGSIPLVSRQALRLIEGDAVRELPQAAPSAEAIVVLSGGRVLAPGAAKISEWTDADRFFGGLELYAAGKAPLLVFTGGSAPWEPTAPSEGEMLVGFARGFGVPAEAAVTTGKVFNTADEATAVAGLLTERRASGKLSDPPTVLLVTSAFHMPRAMVQFEAAGLRVEPYPVDFLVSSEKLVAVMDFLPTASALSQTELALREFYGRIFYRIRHGK